MPKAAVVRLKTTKRQAGSFKRRSARAAQNIQRFADIVMVAVEAKLSNTAFTRDDVCTLVGKMRLDSTEEWARGAAGVNDVTTQTRYRKVCDAVTVLLDDRRLASLDWLRLCRPSLHAKLSQEIAPHLLYISTIRRLAQGFPTGTTLDAMVIVNKWRSDQHLPENLKRMAVRGALPMLVTEKLLQRGENGEFITR